MKSAPLEKFKGNLHNSLMQYAKSHKYKSGNYASSSQGAISREERLEHLMNAYIDACAGHISIDSVPHILTISHNQLADICKVKQTSVYTYLTSRPAMMTALATWAKANPETNEGQRILKQWYSFMRPEGAVDVLDK